MAQIFISYEFESDVATVHLIVHTNVCLCTGSPSDSKDGERHLRAGNLAHSTGD